MLRELRKPGETGYKIPVGGLYRLLSCPNYFGELLEWIGFAIAAWSLPAFMFAVYTAATSGAARAWQNRLSGTERRSPTIRPSDAPSCRSSIEEVLRERFRKTRSCLT